MRSRRYLNSVRAPPGPPATTGSTPQSSTQVAPAVETTNEDGSCTANVDQFEHADLDFDPPGYRIAWNLVPKWPVIHRHLIAELDFLATYYNTVGQADNIKAAKAWHGTFPPEDLVGHETAYFYRGKKVEISEIDLQEAPMWVEGPPPDDYWTYYDRLF